MAEITFTFDGDISPLLAALEEANAEIDQFTGETEEAGQALDDMGDSAADAGKETKKAGADMKEGFKVAAVAAAAAAAAVTGVVKAVLDFAEATNQIAKRAKEVGTTAEEYQKLQGVLDLMTRGGVDASIVIQTLGRNIDEAAQGNKEYAKTFERMKIDLDALRAATPTDQLVMFAAGLENLEDKAARSAASMELLGRGGKMLGPAFDEGGAAILANAQKIEDAGLISNETAAQSEALADAALLLGNTFDALKAEVLEPLIPKLQETAENIQAIILEAKETGKLEELGQALDDLFSDDLLGMIEDVTRALTELGKAIDFTRNAFDLLGVAELPLDLFHDLAAAVYTLDFRFDNATETVQNFSAALRELFGLQKSAKQISREFEESGFSSGGDDPDAGPSAPRKFQFSSRAWDGAEEKRTDARKEGAKDREKVAEEEAQAEIAALDEVALRAARYADLITEYHKSGEDARLEYTLENLAQIGEAYEEAAAERIAAAEAAAEQERAIASDVVGYIQSAMDAVARIAWMVADEKIEAAQDGSAAEKAAALEAFEAAQAVAIVTASISTALAMIEGLAAGLAIGGPAGIALGIATMAFAATAGGIAIGEIASESPPAFEYGGRVPGAGPVPITAHGGEEIATRRAVENNPGIVDAMNRGETIGGGPTVVALKLDTRTVQMMEHRSLSTGTGPLNERLRALRFTRLGHRLPQGYGV